MAELNRAADVAIVVDDVKQIVCLRDAPHRGDQPLRVLVDVDVGQARTGVTQIGDAVRLADAIAASPGLVFAGIQGFAGHAQHIVDPQQRRDAARRCGCASAGGPSRPLITGGGTGTYVQDAVGPYNELQAGSYVFMDADYARIADEAGAGPSFAPSLLVLATVVSVNRPGEIAGDAAPRRSRRTVRRPVTSAALRRRDLSLCGRRARHHQDAAGQAGAAAGLTS